MAKRKKTLAQVSADARATLAPFYDRGDFDHRGLIDELERRAGRLLKDGELRSLSRLVDAYVSERNKLEGFNGITAMQAMMGKIFKQ